MEEAKSKLNPKLDISSDRLAVIPTKWNTEVFCYEFKGNINGNDFLIYINAETGEEQDILMIINTLMELLQNKRLITKSYTIYNFDSIIFCVFLAIKNTCKMIIYGI